MPIIDAHQTAPVSPAQMVGWKPLHRIENTGADVGITREALAQYPFERRLYAEGDSWFDKFTPIPRLGTNLLDALRLPAFSCVVDAAHIGDTAAEMLSSRSRRQTQAQFDLFDYDAILLSAGGNDLIELFQQMYDDLDQARRGQMLRPESSARLQSLTDGPTMERHFDALIQHVEGFLALRDRARSPVTRAAPLLLHGYELMQPRPTRSPILAGTRLGRGPWLYEVMQRAGLSDAQMGIDAAVVIDRLNQRLRAWVGGLDPKANVWFIDQRGTVERAAPGSSGVSGDWADEIHLSASGYEKLATRFWNPWLARLLNLV